MNKRQEQAIDAVAKANRGRLTPRALVEAARPARSVLHGLFTWDEKRAAQKCRLDEARELIASYRVVITTEPFVIRAPVYVRDPSAAPDQGYISVSRLRTDAELARDVLIFEFDRVVAALRRAKEVGHAIGMADEIDRLQRQVEQLVGRVPQPEARA